MTCHTPDMRLTLFFNRMVFQSSGSVVSSLSIADDSDDILSLLCKDTGQPGTTGHLELGIDLGFSVGDSDSALPTAFKELDPDTKQFKAGPIVTGLKAGGANILLAGEVQGGEGTPFEDHHYGLVTITLLENVLGGELPVDLVKLDGVTEEAFNDLIAIGWPASKRTSFRGRVRIPEASGITQMSVEWRGWIFGKKAGDMPTLEMTVRKISAPNPPGTPIGAPLIDQDHVLDTSTLGTYTANQYAELRSDPLIVLPGDVLLFTITRPAGDDGLGDDYDEEVHVINQFVKIVGSS